MNQQEFEDYVKSLDDNIEDVTTCLAESENGEKEHGLVITVKGVDVVLLKSDLIQIVEFLDNEIIF